MQLPRRAFLKSTAAAAATIPVLRSLGATTSDNTPGLLFDPADLPRIRRNLEHPRLATVRTKLADVDHAERLHFIRHESDLRNRVRHMREIREDLENSALAYAVWRKPIDLELATAALKRILQYDPWDYFVEGANEPLGFQRAPEATIATCCALDWIGNDLDPALVAETEKQIAEKGAPACYNALYGMMYPDRVRGWNINHAVDDIGADFDLSRWPLILNSTNLKIIPTCALGFAALWLQGRHPQADKWLQMSRRSAQAFSTIYGLDGSYDEGVGYWGYTTLHLAMLAEVLYRRAGVDERDLINYPGTTRFALAMCMPRLGSIYQNPNEKKEYNYVPKGAMDPASDIINFGDSGVGTDTTIASWIGQNHDDPVSNFAAAEIGSIKHLPGAIWFDPDARTQAPGKDLLDTRLNNDWVISRTDWTPASTVVALRSGGPANHEHADRNSLIFKAHGERIFHDPFKAAYSPTHSRWLLRLTEAHTAVLVDGKGHQYHDGSEGTNASWAQANVTGYRAGDGALQVTSDATSAYQLINDKIARVDRTVLFLKPDVLLILDRLDMAKGHPAELTARFQIFNEDNQCKIAVRGQRFDIDRPFAGLQGQCFTRDGIPTLVRDQLDLPAEEGEFPFIAAMTRRTESDSLLTVVTAYPAGGSASPLSVKSTATGWRIRGTHRGLEVDTAVDLNRAALPFT